MSQQEINNACDSIRLVLLVLIPCAVVSAIVSICDFFYRHYGVEPFKLSRLIIGVGTDTIYGGLVGLAAFGAARSHCLAWAAAGFAVHMGMRKVEKTLSDICYKKLGMERRKNGKD